MSSTPNYNSSKKQGEDKQKINGKKAAPVFDAGIFTDNAGHKEPQPQPSPLDNYAPYRITDATEVTTPQPVVTINGETIASRESVVTFSGASKSGKSALTGWMIALALADDTIMDAPDGLHVEPANCKAIVHFDTEQSRHDHKDKLLSILRRTGFDACPHNLLSYNIRELDINEYETITSGIIEAANKVCGGVHMIVIDGIADYIREVNDEEQSTAIVKYVQSLAITYHAPVIVIVHTNPNSDKERGHLGSQLQRKSQSTVQVKKEDEITLIEPKLLRNAGNGNTPVMQLIYDREKGYHVGCGTRNKDAESKDAERLAKVQECCTRVFAPPAALNYDDAILKVMNHTKKKDRTAKDIFKEMNAHGMITKGADGNWRIKQQVQ